MLELNDVGEEPRLGSMLVTPVGDGVFVYTALSFFRQWADRVPGAYRLFANLIEENKYIDRNNVDIRPMAERIHRFL